MKKMLNDLKSQLTKKGISSPEKYQDKISNLSDSEIDHVSGATDLGFAKAFAKNDHDLYPPFTKTIFERTAPN